MDPFHVVHDDDALDAVRCGVERRQGRRQGRPGPGPRPKGELPPEVGRSRRRRPHQGQPLRARRRTPEDLTDGQRTARGAEKSSYRAGQGLGAERRTCGPRPGSRRLPRPPSCSTTRCAGLLEITGRRRGEEGTGAGATRHHRRSRARPRNGRVEAINNKIKVAVRMATTAFRDADNLVALLMCGGLPPSGWPGEARAGVKGAKSVAA